MTDIRRTLLWVVFTMSLVLLWDAWNKHTGQPTLFGSPAPRPAASAPPSTATPASQVGVPTPIASTVPGPAGPAAGASPGVPAISGAASPVCSEKGAWSRTVQVSVAGPHGGRLSGAGIVRPAIEPAHRSWVRAAMRARASALKAATEWAPRSSFRRVRTETAWPATS